MVVTHPDVAAIESPRPYVHPMLDARGRSITDFRPADHKWHHGLSLALPIVRRAAEGNVISFWGGPTFTRDRGYVDLNNHGSQVVVKVAGRVSHIEWREPGGGVLLRERRMVRPVELDADAWALEIVSEWRANDALVFGSPTTEGRPAAGYGGLFLRAAPRFRGAAVILDGVAVRTSDAMGREAQWCALGHPGEGSICMVVGSDSARARGPWFIRSDSTPMICAAPFFDEELFLERGSVLRWRWFLLSTAADMNAESLTAAVHRLPAGVLP